ncbi:MAG: hypothetical protein JRF56_08580 [Deltaproteobacteria bacterium]|jgi:type I restriction enzyme S subunit|nr:hypothetical protein [Deltaproteobacteria bacterium]
MSENRRLGMPFFKKLLVPLPPLPEQKKNRQLRRVINTGVRNDGLLNLNPDAFFSIKIKVPAISEQQGIMDFLISATCEINQLEKKLKALEIQKRGLMQKLLTGEVRVKVNDNRGPAEDNS